MIPIIITVGVIIGFKIVISDKRFWQGRLVLRLPLLVGTCYFIFAIPIILKLSDNIHSVYGMIFGILNSPVIFLFGNKGILAQIELFIFKDRSLYTSDIVFVGISLFFWFFVSLAVGVIIDISRKKNSDRTGTTGDNFK